MVMQIQVLFKLCLKVLPVRKQLKLSSWNCQDDDAETPRRPYRCFGKDSSKSHHVAVGFPIGFQEFADKHLRREKTEAVFYESYH